MKLEIFPILPVEVEGRFLLDVRRRVACVEVDTANRRGRLHFDEPRWEKALLPLFSEDCLEMFGHGQGGDAMKIHPAWSEEAVDVICRDKLTRLSLGARPMWAGAPAGEQKG